MGTSPPASWHTVQPIGTMNTIRAILLFVLAAEASSTTIPPREEMPVDVCCDTKTVGDYKYNKVDSGSGKVPRNCLNDCIYSRDDKPGSKYCFASGEQEVHCLDVDLEPSALAAKISICNDLCEDLYDTCLKHFSIVFCKSGVILCLHECSIHDGILVDGAHEDFFTDKGTSAPAEAISICNDFCEGAYDECLKKLPKYLCKSGLDLCLHECSIHDGILVDGTHEDFFSDTTEAPEPSTLTISWSFGAPDLPAVKCVNPGTTVTFEFGFGHNVNKLATAQDYNDCTGIADTTGGSGPISKTLTDTGVYYFACGVGPGFSHCNDGNMKAKITVSNNC